MTDKPDKSLRLSLIFPKGGMYFYTCSVKPLNLSFYLLSTGSGCHERSVDPEKLNRSSDPIQNDGCDALMDQIYFPA
ncbi:hypothetical protein EJ377_00245 [Chryseobacterium arthrosphaerae]|uniref:Uncharacterized protein n=1 Tax=Chryseobacterium arthrosphaerae TaxID=651561 RepID=A0A432DY86_9FLAO|nr:hypothetical protein EJ377_00245 [Chryseobacterium arthrosphaerae]